MSAITDLEDLDPADIQALVGQVTFGRAREYARSRVLELDWDPYELVLRGQVQGQGRVYSTVARFQAGPQGRLRLASGTCSCPMVIQCKHVAAIALAASRSAPSGGSSRHASPAPVPAWEQALSQLLRPTDQTDRRPTTPLAIQLSLKLLAGPDGRARDARVLATVVRPGRGGSGWVNGGLEWSGPSTWYASVDRYSSNQLRVLREIQAAHGARVRGGGYAYSPPSKTIDLGEVGPTLWTLLDDAVRIGIPLVHGTKGMGELDPPGRAELVLDLTGAEGGDSVLTPRLLVPDSGGDPVAIAFLGEEGHGVVHVDRAHLAAEPDPTRLRFALSRLAVPAPPRLQRLVQGSPTLRIPAPDRARFAMEMWPRLRHIATITSSDDSFVPPQISGPTVALDVIFGEGHQTDLAWSFRYRVDDVSTDVPLRPDPTAIGPRDLAAEDTLTRTLVEEELAALSQSLDLTDAEGRLRPHLHLAGMQTMTVVEELLPLLADHPDVTVRVEGTPSDYREVGDTLVIGVSTDAVPDQTDWFDLGVSIQADGREVPFAEVFAALAAGTDHMLLDDGAYFSLDKPDLQALRRLIEEARGLQETPSGPLRLSRFQADLWAELAALGVITRQAQAWQRQVEGLLSVEGVQRREAPQSLHAELRPYQHEGFEWLAFLWDHDLGGILADDMGLGKTLQALALICHAREADPDGPPFLVVAPTSVVSNWAVEAARFSPDLNVAVVDSTLKKAGVDITEVVAGADIVITTYTLFRLDVDAYGSVPLAGLLLDEAQMAKNHRSKVYGCIRRLNTPFKLAITGTPMENNLMELWSLLSITAPGLFPDPKQFERYYARPIQREGDAELLAQLRRRIRPLMTRRTKEQVAADLPAKQEQVLDVELHPRHRRIYARQLQRERQRILGLLDDLDSNRFTILRSLTLLRQLSLHPGLVDPAHDEVPCAKLDTLVEHLVEVVDGNHRALVFSQFTGFLARVRQRLDAEGIDYCYLDGSTRNRPKVIERFREGQAPVFLISLKAGGFGLNLTEADYCFLLDPWWNPATEAQAIDRTHRIGQTRTVMVYRLIAADTIEQKVLALARRKAELFGGVMGDGEALSGTLTAADIHALLA